MFWEGSVDTLIEFLQILIVSTLKFTLYHGIEKFNFLDVSIQKTGTRLETDLYKKDTDRNNLLHNTSFHPQVLLKSLPMTQFKRVKRIVSSEQQCELHLKEMSEWFVERGYSRCKLNENLTAIQRKTPIQ
ncbi:hypothetical protein XELAEV_18031369mg [Xenopus laevis]|uniref:Helix-turn-helix domain-containing protein n=1 Tax=Xenopus laevis TaxID=8355 RepID=A0A974CMX9_XENLA|nr:hypothetical protein XELAEV_18031369mg [Xenopus laevis]